MRTPYLSILTLYAMAFVAVLTTSAVVHGADLLPWKGDFFEGQPAAILDSLKDSSPEDAEATQFLLWDERIQVFDDHRRRFVSRRVYRVQSRDDVELRGAISAVWTPWRHSKPVMRARVITPDGKIHELDQATIAESSASNVQDQTYRDSRLLSAPLPAMGCGCCC